jgi:hypothetical protein
MSNTSATAKSTWDLTGIYEVRESRVEVVVGVGVGVGVQDIVAVVVVVVVVVVVIVHDSRMTGL